jgi:hypothetical protein
MLRRLPGLLVVAISDSGDFSMDFATRHPLQFIVSGMAYLVCKR